MSQPVLFKNVNFECNFFNIDAIFFEQVLRKIGQV